MGTYHELSFNIHVDDFNRNKNVLHDWLAQK